MAIALSVGVVIAAYVTIGRRAVLRDLLGRLPAALRGRPVRILVPGEVPAGAHLAVPGVLHLGRNSSACWRRRRCGRSPTICSRTREAKRVFGLVGAGGVTGWIVSGLLAERLARIQGLGTESVLLVMAVGILVGAPRWSSSCGAREGRPWRPAKRPTRNRASKSLRERLGGRLFLPVPHLDRFADHAVVDRDLLRRLAVQGDRQGRLPGQERPDRILRAVQLLGGPRLPRAPAPADVPVPAPLRPRAGPADRAAGAPRQRAGGSRFSARSGRRSCSRAAIRSCAIRSTSRRSSCSICRYPRTSSSRRSPPSTPSSGVSATAWPVSRSPSSPTGSTGRRRRSRSSTSCSSAAGSRPPSWRAGATRARCSTASVSGASTPSGNSPRCSTGPPPTSWRRSSQLPGSEAGALRAGDLRRLAEPPGPRRACATCSVTRRRRCAGAPSSSSTPPATSGRCRGSRRCCSDPDGDVRSAALLFLDHHAPADPLTRIKNLDDFQDVSVASGIVTFLAQLGRPRAPPGGADADGPDDRPARGDGQARPARSRVARWNAATTSSTTSSTLCSPTTIPRSCGRRCARRGSCASGAWPRS